MPATSCRPRPPSASRSAGRSPGTPGPPRSATSTRTMPSPALTATVTVSPGAPDPLCRTLLPNNSLTSSAASPRTGAQGPSTPPTNARATRARSACPATVTLSRTAAQPSAHRLPAAPPREKPGGRADTGIHARLGAARQAGTRRRRGPSVAVRQPTTHTAPAPLPSAMRPWTPQHDGPQRYKVTHSGTEKNGPPSREFPASGPFPQVWQVMGSNHRRLSRRFYRTLAPTESRPADRRGRGSRRVCGPSPSAMRPCDPGQGGRGIHGRGRTAAAGAVPRPSAGAAW